MDLLLLNVILVPISSQLYPILLFWTLERLFATPIKLAFLHYLTRTAYRARSQSKFKHKWEKTAHSGQPLHPQASPKFKSKK